MDEKPSTNPVSVGDPSPEELIRLVELARSNLEDLEMHMVICSYRDYVALQVRACNWPPALRKDLCERSEVIRHALDKPRHPWFDEIRSIYELSRS